MFLTPSLSGPKVCGRRWVVVVCKPISVLSFDQAEQKYNVGKGEQKLLNSGNMYWTTSFGQIHYPLSSLAYIMNDTDFK